MHILTHILDFWRGHAFPHTTQRTKEAKAERHGRRSPVLNRIPPTNNKKLSYRRQTARRAMSVETARNVAQMFVELHLISRATGE